MNRTFVALSSVLVVFLLMPIVSWCQQVSASERTWQVDRETPEAQVFAEYVFEAKEGHIINNGPSHVIVTYYKREKGWKDYVVQGKGDLLAGMKLKLTFLPKTSYRYDIQLHPEGTESQGAVVVED